MEMKKITIFTASLWNDGYLETPLHKFCIDTWQRAKLNIENQGYECEIKIFNYDDELVKEYFDEIGLHKESKSKAVVTDGFKIFILSKFPNHLWFDLDLWISYNYIFKDELYFNTSQYYIYNSDNTDFFKYIYDKYKTGEFVDKDDKQVFVKLGFKKPKCVFWNTIRHLQAIDNNNKIIITDEQNLIDKAIKIGNICIMTKKDIVGFPSIIYYWNIHKEIVDFVRGMDGKFIIEQ